jgi:hypothetical protein
MTPERFIENNVAKNRAQLGYGDSVVICRSRLGRGFGVVDVALLPLRGSHRLVLVEAKQGTAQDGHVEGRWADPQVLCGSPSTWD